jgi:hypothetical protein
MFCNIFRLKNGSVPEVRETNESVEKAFDEFPADSRFTFPDPEKSFEAEIALSLQVSI